jgi:molecular chaperone GrpE
MTDSDTKAANDQPVEPASAAEAGAPTPAPTEPTTSREEAEKLHRELEEAKKKAAEHYDQWLRSVAELRNYKKRVDQEREYQSRDANAALIAQLLPALDDLDRAMHNLPDEKLLHFSWIEGILLIYRRLQLVLEQFGLKPVEAIGKIFDPYMHEAVLFEEVPAEKDQLVLADLQKGYKLYDRVLRPTLVKVGRGMAPAPEPVEETPPGGETTPPPGPEEAKR